jgi:hypothetical protein
MRFARPSRKIHRVGAIISALPVLIVIVTGLVLQVKKEFEWVQPGTAKPEAMGMVVSFEQVLDAVKTVEEANLQSWDDIDRLDVRPGKGVIKVRGKNRWEIQLASADATVLKTAYRRSDFFEELHDGSWFSDGAKLWIFLPSAIIMFLLWLTGIYLWLLPYRVRRAKRKRALDNDH